MNKCIMVVLKNCKELEYKTMDKTLRDIQYLTCKASNKAMQMYYAWEYEKMDYKNKYGEYPKEQEKFGKTYRNIVEAEMKTIMNTINTSNVGQTNAFVMKKWNTDKSDILNYRKSVASFKLDMPIYLKNNSYKISQGNNSYEIDCAIFNKYQDLKHLNFQIDKLDGNKKATLNKIIAGAYKQGALQITKNKKSKWCMFISFGFEAEQKEVDENRILGVDLGITNVATMQIWDKTNEQWERLNWKESIVDGKELIHYRQKIEAKNKDMSIASKCVGNGRSGHGYKTRMKPLEKTRDKVANFRDTYNHKVSKYIVDMAEKHKCGTIQMEDLSGFTEQQSESLLRNWSYYDLQSKIQYKAEEKGIKVNFINPYLTSKRCSECGNIDKENRDCKSNQAKFKCTVCGHEENADINAAKNISLPDIEKLIEEQPKSK